MNVCFIGHRKIQPSENLTTRIRNRLYTLIQNNASTFIFGSRSEFDTLCWKIVTELKETYPHIQRIKYNAPHETAFVSKAQREQFEKMMSDALHKSVFLEEYEKSFNVEKALYANKNAYIMRNQAMIDNSDVCVFYYNANYLPPKRIPSARSIIEYQPKSGTAVAYAYALEKKKQILNLFTE